MPVGTQMYSLDTLLWALFAGVTIAVIYTTCMKAALGGFVRALIDAAAVDPLTAKSAEELGFGGKKAVIRSLRPGGSLGRCLGRHPEDETKFFIPARKGGDDRTPVLRQRDDRMAAAAHPGVAADSRIRKQ